MQMQINNKFSDIIVHGIIIKYIRLIRIILKYKI